MNLNKLAQHITLKEGKKINLSIAQVKEVLHITLSELKNLTIKQLIELLARTK